MIQTKVEDLGSLTATRQATYYYESGCDCLDCRCFRAIPIPLTKVELIYKLCAKIIKSHVLITDSIVPLDEYEWIGLDLLQRDDEL